MPKNRGPLFQDAIIWGNSHKGQPSWLIVFPLRLQPIKGGGQGKYSTGSVSQHIVTTKVESRRFVALLKDGWTEKLVLTILSLCRKSAKPATEKLHSSKRMRIEISRHSGPTQLPFRDRKEGKEACCSALPDEPVAARSSCTCNPRSWSHTPFYRSSAWIYTPACPSSPHSPRASCCSPPFLPSLAAPALADTCESASGSCKAEKPCWN